jgi:RNA polymerase sigma factor (sigma-70 family)
MRGTRETLVALWERDDWGQLVPHLMVVALRTARLVAGGELTDDDIDDIVQNTIIRCWQLDEVPLDPAAYASAIARNLCRDLPKYGHQKFRATETERLHAFSRTEDDTFMDALSSLLEEEEHAALREAIRKVPEKYRRILVLHHFHYRTVPQLSEQFGLEIGAIKMRLFRGRASLTLALGSLAPHDMRRVYANVMKRRRRQRHKPEIKPRER